MRADAANAEALARTEQGFWATQFDFLYECEGSVEELRAAASAVGFRYLDRHLSAREAAGSRLATFEGHAAWLRELVAGIDRDAQNVEQSYGLSDLNKNKADGPRVVD